MDEIALLSRAGAEFERRLGAVTPGQLLQPSPCEEWTVRDLVSHVVGESIMSVRLLHGASAGESIVGLDDDILGDDAFAAWATAASVERAAFEEPGAMRRVVHHPAMDMPGPSYSGSGSAASFCTPGTWLTPPAATRLSIPIWSRQSGRNYHPWRRSLRRRACSVPVPAGTLARTPRYNFVFWTYRAVVLDARGGLGRRGSTPGAVTCGDGRHRHLRRRRCSR